MYIHTCKCNIYIHTHTKIDPLMPPVCHSLFYPYLLAVWLKLYLKISHVSERQFLFNTQGVLVALVAPSNASGSMQRAQFLMLVLHPKRCLPSLGLYWFLTCITKGRSPLLSLALSGRILLRQEPLEFSQLDFQHCTPLSPLIPP